MGISHINCNMDLTFLSSFIIRHKFPGGQNRVPFKGAVMTSPSSQACWIWGLGCGWNEVPSQKGKGSASMCVPCVPDIPDPSPRWSWLVPKLLPFLWVHLSIPNTVFTGFWLNCVHITWWREIINLMFKASLPMRNTIWKRRKMKQDRKTREFWGGRSGNVGLPGGQKWPRAPSLKISRAVQLSERVMSQVESTGDAKVLG